MVSYIKRPPEKLELTTIKKYGTTFTHLKAFRKELFFSDIDNGLMRDFTRKMQNDAEYGNIILGARDKNGNQTIIPLFKFPYSKTILERYESGPRDKLVFDKKYLVEKPAYNRNLKDIAKLAGFTKTLPTRWPGTPTHNYGSDMARKVRYSQR